MSGTIRPVSIAVAAAVALLVFATSANASHVQCGDTIAQSTKLDSDVVCPPEAPRGVVIGADNVTLRLAGHTIRGQSGNGTGVWAIPEEGEYTNVHVRGGTIEGFGSAVRMAASDSSLRKLTTSGDDAQIITSGRRNVVSHNDVTDLGGQALGLYLQGDDVLARDNTVRGAAVGIYTLFERPRLVRNTIENCGGPAGTGIVAAFYNTEAIVNRNVVSGCLNGIHAFAGSDAGAAVIGRNETNGNTQYGLLVNDAHAIVERNTANNNGETGIRSNRPGTRIQRNVANDNGNYGIFATPGTIDGGRNTATGNGDGTNPQCVNVQCAP